MKAALSVTSTALVLLAGCGDFFAGYEAGKSERLDARFGETCGRVQALTASANQAALAGRCAEAREITRGGTIGLMEAAAWLATLDTVIADGEITDEELEMVEEDWLKVSSS